MSIAGSRCVVAQIRQDGSLHGLMLVKLLLRLSTYNMWRCGLASLNGCSLSISSAHCFLIPFSF